MFVGQLASYLLLASEPACSRHLLPSHPPPQRHAWAISSLPFRMQRPDRAFLLLPRPRNLPRQYQQQQRPNVRPKRQVTKTLGSQLWTHKSSVRQSLQARRLELLLVVLCPTSVPARDATPPPHLLTAHSRLSVNMMDIYPQARGAQGAPRNSDTAALPRGQLSGPPIGAFFNGSNCVLCVLSDTGC